jgi:tetratricopeptide (TPR) repeat protein
MLGELGTLREVRQASQFLTLLDRMLNACATSKQWALGESAVEESHNAWSSGLFAADDLFLLIRHVSNYYMAASNHEAVISLYLQAVDHFADFDAFQPAYRLLHDAEIYAAEHCDVHGNLRVKDRAAEICITEGDLDYATKVLRSLRKVRRRFGLETPIGLEMNYGNLQMRKEHYEPALKTFRRGLDSKHPAYLRLPCLLNSSICLRELGDFTKAEQCLAGARALCDETTETSHLVELDLVEAKTCIAMGQSARAADCLRNAVQHIDTLLVSAGRLHYRRGIRERYRSRIVHLLHGLPPLGETQSILSLIAFIKGNSSSDWLALLDWRSSLSTGCISKEVSDRFEKTLASVAAAGAPVLYGYREKYDEPWATPWTTDEETFTSVSFAPTIPWAELNAAITEICTITGQERPWDAASSERRSRELLQSMGRSGRILAQTFTGSTASLYLISGDHYERIDLPRQKVSKLSVLFAMHKAGQESARDFRERLTLFTDELAGLLSAPLDTACASGFDSLTILPEAIFFPVNASLMAHEGVRSLMAAGRFSIRTCPIVHVGKNRSGQMGTVSACDVAGDDLKLNEAELGNIARILAPAKTMRHTLSGESAAEPLFENDVLHVAAHGVAISNLRDAFFGGATGSQPLSNFYSLQWRATQGRSQIVFLNSCFSADTLNWNVMEPFRTSEQIGISSMFLLNRRAAIVATTWATFDSAAYIFAQLFYTALANKADAQTAFAEASAALHDMDVGTVHKSLESVHPPELGVEKQAVFRGAGRPFSHPYVAGNYQLLCLLPPARPD